MEIKRKGSQSSSKGPADWFTGTVRIAPIAMGPAYWIPAVAVPLLLVTHYVTFVLLLRGWK